MPFKSGGVRDESMRGIEEAAANLHASIGALQRCLVGGADDGAVPSTTEAAAAQAAADSAEPAVELEESALPRRREANRFATVGALIVLVGVGVLLATAIARRRPSLRK